MPQSTPIPRDHSRRQRMAEAVAKSLLTIEQPKWHWHLTDEAMSKQIWGDAPTAANTALLELRQAILEERTEQVMLVYKKTDTYWDSLDDGDEAK